MKKILIQLILCLSVTVSAQESNTNSQTILDINLQEVVVSSGVIDIAKERETPIAVTTISSQEVLLKVGNQEFPEIMNKTPGVYATKQGGGEGTEIHVYHCVDLINVILHF